MPVPSRRPRRAEERAEPGVAQELDSMGFQKAQLAGGGKSPHGRLCGRPGQKSVGVAEAFFLSAAWRARADHRGRTRSIETGGRIATTRKRRHCSGVGAGRVRIVAPIRRREGATRSQSASSKDRLDDTSGKLVWQRPTRDRRVRGARGY
jgi:hypothetical protein